MSESRLSVLRTVLADTWPHPRRADPHTLAQPWHRSVEIDRHRFTQLARLAGITPSQAHTSPALLLACTFDAVIARLLAADVPLRAVGLVHHVTRWRCEGTITPTQRLTQYTTVTALQPARPGRAAGMAFWVSTTLQGPTGQAQFACRFVAPKATRPAAEYFGMDTVPTLSGDAATRLPDGPCGALQIAPHKARTWAKVGQDRNPIHTSTLVAKAAGYRSTLAHGLFLWAGLDGAAQLQPAEAATSGGVVIFRSPVELPTTAQCHRTVSHGGAILIPEHSERPAVLMHYDPQPSEDDDLSRLPGEAGLLLPEAHGRASASRVVQTMLAAAAAELSLTLPEVNSWRSDYPDQFRALTQAEARGNAVAAARAGLRAAWAQVRLPDGRALDELDVTAPPATDLRIPPQRTTAIALPATLSPMTTRAADALNWAHWREAGIGLSDATVVVLGGAAELAPTLPLLQAGVRVAAVVRSSSPRRESLRAAAEELPGELILSPPEHSDLIAETEAVAQWIAALPGRLILVNCLYDTGSAFVEVALAGDAVTAAVLAARADTVVGLIGTPTDFYATPAGKILDTVLVEQGPNYLAAKRIGRWRARVAAALGHRVLPIVLPAAATHSVMQRRAFATAFRGATTVGLYPAAPADAAAWGAALLAYEYAHPRPFSLTQEAETAIHGGMWGSPIPASLRMRLAYVSGLLHRR